MKKIILITICLTSIVMCLGVGTDPQPTPLTSSTTSSTTSTVKPPITTSSTSTTTNTPPTTTTTTPPTTTTTATPPTTTTPATPPTTTTPATPPTTTPTPPPTTPKPTTPSPTPSEPQTGTWSIVNSTTNYTCILVKMAIEINVTYPVNGSYISKSINLPVNETHASGYCHNFSQQIMITWAADNKNVSNKIVLDFMRNKTSNTFKLSALNVSLQVDSEYFPGLINVSTIDVHNNSGIFNTPIHRSYKCDRVEKLIMANRADNKAGVMLLISHLQLEAFHSANDKVFSTAEDCETTDTPDIVPIAVGCALAGLVIVVLVAYLVGRRRSQARGYLSMLLDNEQDEREEIIPMKEFNCFGR